MGTQRAELNTDQASPVAGLLTHPLPDAIHPATRPATDTTTHVLSTPTPLSHAQPPTFPLPPPWKEGALGYKPKLKPVTKQLYDAVVLFIQTYNAGIQEVGGANWKEVLGRAAEERRRREGSGSTGGSSNAGGGAASGSGAGIGSSSGSGGSGASGASGVR